MIDYFDNKETDESIARFICFVIVSIYVINIVNLVPQLAFGTRFISLAMKVIIGLWFIILVPKLGLLHPMKLQVCLTAFCAVTYVLCYTFFSETRKELVSVALTFWTLCFVPAFVICRLEYYSELLIRLRKFAYISVWINFVLILLKLLGVIQSELGEYSMPFGYACLIPALIILFDLFRKPSAILIVELAIVVATIYLLGSRGPLLSILLFGLYLLVRPKISSSKYAARRFTLYSIASLAIISFFVAGKEVLLVVDKIIRHLGINARSILTLINFSEFDSGRSEIYDVLLKSIAARPLSIRGIAADRVLLGVYSHNVFLELLFEFGILFGGLVVGVIIVCIGRTVLESIPSDRRTVCLVFMFSSVPELMISSSLWENHIFWLWIVSCILLKREKGLHEDAL